MVENRPKDKNFTVKKTHTEAENPTFAVWAEAGFKEHLLPIIPQDAVMSERTTVSEDNRGKVPGNLTQGGWVGFRGWQDMRATDADLASWARLEAEHRAGVGLQARCFPALDIDVMDGPFSDTLAALADLILGDAPERIGRAPKRLLSYALAEGAEPITKTRIEFTLPGTGEAKHAVEVLGAGQQYVVAGVHPGTGRPYAWTGGRSPADMGAGALTPITLDKVERYLDEAVKTITASGGAVLSRSAQGSAGERHLAYAVPDASNVALIEDALAHMGNDLDYDGWVTMTAAIKNALGGDEAHFPIYEAWCLAYPGNDPATARAKWDSMAPPFSVGMGYIFDQAEARGWRGRVQAAFTPVQNVGTAPQPVQTDQTSLAEQFAAEQLDALRFCPPQGAWLVWSGEHWGQDTRETAFNAAKDLCRRVQQSARAQKADALMSLANINAVERIARKDPALIVLEDDLDRDTWLAGMPGGVLDLRNGTKTHADPAKLITKQLGTAPSGADLTGATGAPPPPCPHWLKFIDFATGGDRALQHYLAQIAGLCLTGDTSPQLVWFIYGDGGTGKSTFVRVISKMLGSYATTVPMTAFTAGKADDRGADIAHIAGARLVTATETERGGSLAEGRIKELTGGEPVRARYLYGNFATFIPQAKVIMLGNHAPALSDADASLKRRIRIIPFNQTPTRPDPDLIERLEAELPGILDWAIMGLQSYLGGGLVEPAIVTAETSDYFETQDEIAAFLADECVMEPDAKSRTNEMFDAWQRYARRFNKSVGNRASLTKSLERRGVKRQNVRISGPAVKGYKGVRLKTFAERERDEAMRNLFS